MVESWRQVARAATLGEHDFDAGLGYGRLSQVQCMTLLKDASDVARGLVGLDRRYSNIPGWQPLKEAGWLGRAAETCATFAGYDEPDYTIDLRGWQPRRTLVEGPGLPGLTGVLQAQHNLLVHLGEFPDARSLRLVLDSQRIVSRDAATLDPRAATDWTGARRPTSASSTRPTTSAGWSATAALPLAKRPSPRAVSSSSPALSRPEPTPPTPDPFVTSPNSGARSTSASPR